MLLCLSLSQNENGFSLYLVISRQYYFTFSRRYSLAVFIFSYLGWSTVGGIGFGWKLNYKCSYSSIIFSSNINSTFYSRIVLDLTFSLISKVKGFGTVIPKSFFFSLQLLFPLPDFYLSKVLSLTDLNFRWWSSSVPNLSSYFYLSKLLSFESVSDFEFLNVSFVSGDFRPELLRF